MDFFPRDSLRLFSRNCLDATSDFKLSIDEVIDIIYRPDLSERPRSQNISRRDTAVAAGQERKLSAKNRVSSMDSFLRAQRTGEVVDTANPITIDRAHAREKTLASIPKVDWETICRLLDAAVYELGRVPSECVRYFSGSQDNPPRLYVRLSDADPSLVESVIDELRRPFGNVSGASKLAKAICMGTRLDTTVFLDWATASPVGGAFRHELTLTRDNLQIPEQLAEVKKGELLVTFCTGLEGNVWDSYRATPVGSLYQWVQTPERLLPLHSASSKVSGFFDYRCKPFTLIRSYAHAGAEQAAMQLDLWTGPYTAVDGSSVLLDSKEPGRFLFLTWRPNLGCPTFLHHSLDDELTFGPQRCRATFWVETSDQAARVYLHSDGVTSDPIAVPGPAGLTGVVLWPGLTFDLWGTRPVTNKVYEEAMAWSRIQVARTAETLSKNLDAILDRACASDLIGKSYVEETAARMRRLWQTA